MFNFTMQLLSCVRNLAAQWKHLCQMNIFLSATLSSLLSVCLAQVNEQHNACLIDVHLGYADPKNVYQCKKPLKCCFEYSKPSCCGSKQFWQILKEQITLWGGLFAILMTIASIVYCRKNDIHIPACVAFKSCLTRFCCGDAVNSEQTDSQQQVISLNDNSNLAKLSFDREEKSIRHGWRNNSVNPLPSNNRIQMTRV